MATRKIPMVAIGNAEAIQIRKRLNELNMTQTKLAEDIGVEDRYIRKILKTDKSEPVNVSKDKVDKMISILGVGIDYVFEHEIPHPYKDKSYLLDFFENWCNKILRRNGDKQASHLASDEVLNRTVRFGNTAIMKSIADHYGVVKDFFEKKTSFLLAPKEKYWKYFTTTPEEIQNTYILFKLIPTNENSHFKISYTLKSNINLLLIPNQIKILYGEVITYDEYREVIQYYNTPSIYKIKKIQHEINIITWIDRMEHDFVISSNEDFKLIYSVDNTKTKQQVKEIFSHVDTVVFQKHPYFHRQELGEISDEVSFFWGNSAFLDYNPDIKRKM